MAIVSSGAISIQNVYNEFGPAAIAGSTLATTPHSLDEFYSLGNKTSYFTGRAVTSTPNSSTISLDDFYGKSRDLQFNVIGDKGNANDGYPASFTFSSLGFIPGGNLNRWYIVFLTRYLGSDQPNVTMGFDGTAQRAADHTAAFTYTDSNKNGTFTANISARVSVWLYKKNTGGSLTIVTNNNQAYHMGVFEVYTTHNMESSKKTFYAGTARGTVSFVVPAAVGGLFIQTSTNYQNSAQSEQLIGEWLNRTFTTSGNAYEIFALLRGGALFRAGTFAYGGATFFNTAGNFTFSIRDDDSRSGASQNVSGGLYIAP